jgi:hypothetical protein
MTKHTPGPWEYRPDTEDGCIVAVNEDGSTTKRGLTAVDTNSTSPQNSGPHVPTGCAECGRLRSINADLLEACEAMYAEMVRRGDADDELPARMAAAIARARGE